MKYPLMLGTIVGLLMTSGAVVRAADSVTDQVKTDAHSAADSVDSTAHKAKRNVKHHVRKAKTDVKNSTDDNPARKAARRGADAGNDALDKVDDTVHGH